MSLSVDNSVTVDLSAFGQNVRRIRRDQELSQKYLADVAGIHQQQLSLIERGLSPTLDHISKLATALGVTPDDLLRA